MKFVIICGSFVSLLSALVCLVDAACQQPKAQPEIVIIKFSVPANITNPILLDALYTPKDQRSSTQQATIDNFEAAFQALLRQFYPSAVIFEFDFVFASASSTTSPPIGKRQVDLSNISGTATGSFFTPSNSSSKITSLVDMSKGHMYLTSVPSSSSSSPSASGIINFTIVQPPLTPQQIASFGIADLKVESESKYLGCYADSLEERAFLYGTEFIAYDNLINCFVYCDNLGGFSFVGLQFFDNCWCGNILSMIERYGQLNETACNTPCRGDPDMMCGGFLANSIYTLVLPKK